jgi:hypothetical protein
MRAPAQYPSEVTAECRPSSPHPLLASTWAAGGSHGYLVGAVEAANINDQGGYPVHYDLQLNRLEGTLSPPLISSYSRIRQ